MTKKKKWRLLLVLVCVAAQGGLLYIYLQGSVPDAPVAASPPPLDVSAGMPVARGRIDDFISNVAGYGFDQCSAALHGPTSVDEEGAVDLVFDVSSQCGELNCSLRFLQVLSDRRVAKLYAELKKMPAGESARKAASLFDEKLEFQVAAWRRAMEDLRRYMNGQELQDNAPRQSGSIPQNLHALSASLFLCAVFCEPEVVLEKCDRWYEVIKPIQEEIYGDQDLSGLSAYAYVDALPERLFVLNIYALVFDRHACGPVEQLLESVGKRDPRAHPRFEKTAFYAWDAHTNATDFTHIHGFVPTDDNKILTYFWMARRWGSVTSDERQDEILAAARVLVEECAARKQ